MLRLIACLEVRMRFFFKLDRGLAGSCFMNVEIMGQGFLNRDWRCQFFG